METHVVEPQSNLTFLIDKRNSMKSSKDDMNWGCMVEWYELKDNPVLEADQMIMDPLCRMIL
jgi:hypothetical protein